MEKILREKEIRRNLNGNPYTFSDKDIDRLVASAIDSDRIFVNTKKKKFLDYLHGGTIKAKKMGYPGLPLFDELELSLLGGNCNNEKFKGIQFQDPLTLFVNRLAIQLGIPSAPSWIADDGFIVCDYFESSSLATSSVLSKDIKEDIIIQIIRSNLLRSLLGQTDIFRENNLNTKYGILPIDLDGIIVPKSFDILSIFKWLRNDTNFTEFDDIFKRIFLDDTNKKLKEFIDDGIDVEKILGIIEKEYTNLLQKLLLIDENDLLAITSTTVPFKDCSETIVGKISYENKKNIFIETIQLIQVNCFLQAYKQGNLHILLGIPDSKKEILNSKFSLDEEKIREISLITKDKDFYLRYREYCEKLKEIKTSQAFEDFSKFLSVIKKIGQVNDFSNNEELFLFAGKTILTSLIKRRGIEKVIFELNQVIEKNREIEFEITK